MLHREQLIQYILFLESERVNCESSSILIFLAIKSLKDMTKIIKLNESLKKRKT